MITLLTLFLRRTLQFIALRHWTNAWLLLGCGLFCLRLTFGYDEYSSELLSFYFLSEYMFGFLLIAGCRSLGTAETISIRNEILVLPFVAVAFALPFVASDLTVVLNVHSLILSAFFIIAFVELYRTRIGSFGYKLMLIALALMSLDLLQSVIVFTVRFVVAIPGELLAYNAVIDLVLQMMLGFGMVIVLLELVLSDVKTANEKLKKAHEKLEELAHIDPLTTALNRHAFHGYLDRRGGSGPASGTVGFFDIDDLKFINDMYGHAVGDAAIRSVVRAIRELIRAEDLIFRWGGDEFFVLMVGLDAEAATRRMERLESMLSSVRIDGVYQPIAVGVSRAFSDFSDVSDLESTIADADAKMYQQKQLRKRTRDVHVPPMAVNLPLISRP